MTKKQCKNCHQEVHQRYCANCGQKTSVEPLTMKRLMTEISDNVFQINHGLFFSIKEFTLRPAQGIENYLSGQRKQYFQPIAYAFTLATLFFILVKLTGHSTFVEQLFEGYLMGVEKEDELMSPGNLGLIARVSNNYAYTILLLVPVFALASKIAFFNEKRNYLEHLVLNLYITGHQSIIYGIFAILGLLVDYVDVMEIITLFLSMFYAFFVFCHFFKNTHILIRLIQVLISYLIAMVFLAIFLGVAFSINSGA
jgi:hypothetical protein